MRKLLNTLYVTSPDSYLSLDGENVVIYDNDTELGRIPLHNLEAIVSFGYRGMSPALMGGCAERDISLCVLSPQGKIFGTRDRTCAGKCTTAQETVPGIHESGRKSDHSQKLYPWKSIQCQMGSGESGERPWTSD